MARFSLTLLALGAVQVFATPEPLVLSLARGAVQAAQTNVGRAANLTNAAVRAGSDGVNLILDAAQGLEAVESNFVRGALNTGRGFGSELLTQTRNVANNLRSGLLRQTVNRGVDVAQRTLDTGVNAAILVANTTQGMVNGTVAIGKRLSSRVSGRAQNAISGVSRVSKWALTVKDNALAAVQGLLPSRRTSQ
ncbi:uncharacterized protein LOC113213217 [Frankliniella occidentalis]|uniref:Uncharacterized protein LOC113213217 n=1 Tax=Frankliniella occidentalis TaxID=133901 RepID=A0A6J1T4W6_FRAOC|nr:uncharacterized protein LOC113213217 [Frankliniella occidentalis]